MYLVHAPGLMAWVTSKRPPQLDIWVGSPLMVGETTPLLLMNPEYCLLSEERNSVWKNPQQMLFCRFVGLLIQVPPPCYEVWSILIYATVLGQICSLFLKLCIVFCRCLSGTGFPRLEGVRRVCLHLERKNPWCSFSCSCLGTLCVGCMWDMKSFDVGIEDILTSCFYVFCKYLMWYCILNSSSSLFVHGKLDGLNAFDRGVLRKSFKFSVYIYVWNLKCAKLKVWICQLAC